MGMQPNKRALRELKAAIAAQRARGEPINVTALARQLKVPRTTIQSRMLAANLSIETEVNNVETSLAIKLEDIQRQLAQVKRERDELKGAEWGMRQLREVIGGISERPTQVPNWTLRPTSNKRSYETPMMIWSDWHAGEVVSRSETNGQNEFNSSIMERRARRLVELTIDLCKNHGPGRYPGAVINLLGDFVSGALHPELAKTDDKSAIESALHVRDVLVWALEQMQGYFGRLFIPCAAGNHGRNTHKPEFKRTVYQNFDWLIYQLLIRHFDKNKDISFLVPDSNEAHYQVFGRRYLAMHGDMLGVKGGDGIIGSIGPITRGEMKVGKQSNAFGRDYDYLLMGHWHQQLWLPRIIVNNSLKGFDEYAAKALRAPPSIPSQALWLVHPKWGHTMYREVYLEDQGEENSDPWVVFKR